MKPKLRLLIWEFAILVALVALSAVILNKDRLVTPLDVADLPSRGTTPVANSASTKAPTTSSDHPLTDPARSAWNLLLVNEQFPLEAEWIGSIDKKALPNGLQVDARIYEPLTTMLADAKQLGHRLIVCSAFRSYEKQETLFQTQIQHHQRQGLSAEEAFHRTKTSLAVPGTSEHHTGLAVDIVPESHQNLTEEMLVTPEIRWLYANCHRYGFIVRYPDEKSHITGIIHEPWHYRYVGVPAATAIMQNGSTLEEYLGVDTLDPPS